MGLFELICPKKESRNRLFTRDFKQASREVALRVHKCSQPIALAVAVC